MACAIRRVALNRQNLDVIRSFSSLKSARKVLRTTSDAEIGNSNSGSDAERAGTETKKHITEETGPSSERIEFSPAQESPPEADAGISSPTQKISASNKRRSRHSVPVASIGDVALDSPKKFPSLASPFGVLQQKRDTNSEPAKVYQGRLAGRKCLVTGGTSGIGYAIAKRFLQEGAKSVATISRSQTKIDIAYRKMKKDLKKRIPPFYFIMGDITDPYFHQKLWRNFHLANLDILVNAAGISQSSLNIVTRWETTQQTINTNLSATIGLCKAFSVINLRRSRQPSNMSNNSPGIRRPDLDEASRQGSGTADLGSPCIINIASLLGIKGGYGATAYAASKAGVLGFTRALVCELGQQAHINVRVNALVPGYIDTPMTQVLPPHRQREFRTQIPLRRFGTPEEIADAAVFLASNEYANNCVLNLDGGLSAT